VRLKNKVALVTGAGSGIGAATARRFAAEGARVAVTDVDARAARDVADSITTSGGASCIGLALDVRSEAAWEATVSRVTSEWASFDVLISNAGISFGGLVEEMSLDEWRSVYAVNVEGAFLGAKHAVRAMKAAGAGGAIIFVASASGLRGTAGAAAYGSSKAALRSLARSLALEGAPHQIRVNTVVPGGVRTPMWEAMPFFQDMIARHGGVEGAWTALAGDTPLGRFASADEIAAGIAYLASDDAAFVTGTDLVIDGGYSA
jgi:NAD(P)-dependent dehydrogenase (short-subunit alcohol dehydrogenase family)